MITFITLTQGNPEALKRTLDNVTEWFDGRISQIIVGDLCVFEDDKKAIRGMPHPGLMVYELHFNTLFRDGFGSVLNTIALGSLNDLCLYMNVGEVIESFIHLNLIDARYNCYAFDHAVEKHQWVRMWNRRQLRWSGRIHEEVVGSRNLCPQILFRMADTDKDNKDPFKAAVYNDIKELVYFNQYITIADNPSEKGATNEGWVKYAKRDYDYIKQRMLARGARYEAFAEGDLKKYLDNCGEFMPNNNTDLIVYQ